MPNNGQGYDPVDLPFLNEAGLKMQAGDTSWFTPEKRKKYQQELARQRKYAHEAERISKSLEFLNKKKGSTKDLWQESLETGRAVDSDSYMPLPTTMVPAIPRSEEELRDSLDSITNTIQEKEEALAALNAALGLGSSQSEEATGANSSGVFPTLDNNVAGGSAPFIMVNNAEAAPERTSVPNRNAGGGPSRSRSSAAKSGTPERNAFDELLKMIEKPQHPLSDTAKSEIDRYATNLANTSKDMMLYSAWHNDGRVDPNLAESYRSSMAFKEKVDQNLGIIDDKNSTKAERQSAAEALAMIIAPQNQAQLENTFMATAPQLLGQLDANEVQRAAIAASMARGSGGYGSSRGYGGGGMMGMSAGDIQEGVQYFADRVDALADQGMQGTEEMQEAQQSLASLESMLKQVLMSQGGVLGFGNGGINTSNMPGWNNFFQHRGQ